MAPLIVSLLDFGFTWISSGLSSLTSGNYESLITWISLEISVFVLETEVSFIIVGALTCKSGIELEIYSEFNRILAWGTVGFTAISFGFAMECLIASHIPQRLLLFCWNWLLLFDDSVESTCSLVLLWPRTGASECVIVEVPFRIEDTTELLTCFAVSSEFKGVELIKYLYNGSMWSKSYCSIFYSYLV